MMGLKVMMDDLKRIEKKYLSVNDWSKNINYQHELFLVHFKPCVILSEWRINLYFALVKKRINFGFKNKNMNKLFKHDC